MSENNGTALAVRAPEESTALAMAKFGDGEVLQRLANRIGILYGIGAGLSEAAAKQELTTAQPALLKAAQLTIGYGLVPGLHCFVIKRGKTYSAEGSLEMWKAMADRHAFIGGFQWDVVVEPLEAGEVKERTDPSQIYDPEDRGAVARLYNYRKAREARELGIPYRPKPFYGFWRKNAVEKDEWVNNQKTGSKIWAADQVPAQRSRQDVADRRATRAAIMAEFPMIPLDDFEKRYGSERAYQIRLSQAITHVDAELSEQDRKQHEHEGLAGATFVDQPGGYMDENGDYWATEQPRARKPAVVVSDAPVMAAGQPKNGDGWGDWVTEPDILTAYHWGANSGKFKGGSHAQAAWNKVQDQYKGKPVPEFLAAWRDYVNNHADKPQKEVQQKEAAGTLATSGAEGGETQGANGSGQSSNDGAAATVSPEWQGWQKVDDLFGWAVEAGHYETLDQARVSFANMLAFKGLRYSKQNVAKVHEAWFDFHQQDADGYVEAEDVEEGEFAEIPA